MSNQSELNKLVNVHLGKAGDGTTVKPYVSPTAVDPSLLVAVPRTLNRVDYDIDSNNLPFVGYDAWNGYEFSTLTKNGFPISGWIKFVYPSNSLNIVESKSVKLYLNSFNMAVTCFNLDNFSDLENQIAGHISDAVKAKAEVQIRVGDIDTVRPIRGDFISLEEHCDVEGMKFTEYKQSKDILVERSVFGKHKEFWRSYSLRSNCRVTNQPDWGDVYIYIKHNTVNTLTPESILKYIISMRRENHFHEEITEVIYKNILDKISPEELFVACLYTRRGGIDINPVRASSDKLLEKFAPIIKVNNFCTKTARQ